MDLKIEFAKSLQETLVRFKADGSNVHEVNQILTKIRFCVDGGCEDCKNCVLEKLFDRSKKIFLKK